MSPETLVSKEQTKTSKALMIVFPDARTTGGPRQLNRELTPFEKKRCSITEKIFRRYKQNGYKIFGLVYKDTTSDRFSQYYPQAEFDQLIRIPTDFADWTHGQYQAAIPKVISEMNLADEARVFVGGYHATDCVAQFTAGIQDRQINAAADLRLSDKLQGLVIFHTARNATRHLDKEAAWHDYHSWQLTKHEVEREIEKRRKT